MSSVRAFLAIPLPQSLENELALLIQELRAQSDQIRWARPENLHITLHFFGDITHEILEKATASMLSITGSQKPFRVEVAGLGAFPDLKRPRVIWLGLRPQNQLRQLYLSCQKALSTAGIVSTIRPYTPHLTIGRVRNPRHIVTQASRIIGDSLIGTMTVDRLILFESRLKPGGAEHRPLKTLLFEENSGL